MTTKAELEAELAQLKAELAHHMDGPGAPDVAVEPDSTADATTAPDADLSRLRHVLAEHGLDEDDLKAAGQRFLDELQELHQDKPTVTLAAAFAIGCVVGRAMK